MLVYLKPLSIFPELHSDTLFGAITYAVSELYPELVADMINAFKEEPPFVLSSTFPFVFKQNINVRFYPKIITKKSSKDESVIIDSQDFKDFKDVEYLEEQLFFELINGNLTESDILKDFKSYNVINKILLLKDEIDIDVAIGKSIIPNNSVNRLTNKTDGIFYTSGNEYKNIGLFFLIEFFDENYIPIVKAALRFLRDRGFGKDISNGKGQFDYEIDEEFSIDDLYTSNNLDYFVTLSRFIPKIEDLEKINEYSSYEIGSKRGKSPSNEIRKQIRFFKEGSIFPNYKKYYGQLIKSGKDSPAVEYGFAFPIKCIGNKED
ncbi:type III-A CRISPR-associated RAMP protein Csm4 [uncultured Methanobrevibacter sp.]|uniref:type III-A CRISPR-associated RAMP protein Csm4 n=1 Tax=uncultured Methanobrevibacter sp. TaxID=253161 RepID=UPI0026177413|nr:type III-A CRISPR-associated RAMP protein Csm4 [uncultured Methanobrevibacter sp.]